MSTPTLAESIENSLGTGREATFYYNSNLYEFSPSGLISFVNAAPAVLRGTVSGSTWDGVTKGAGASSSVRQANLTGLQAAINYASDNNKFFELEPGVYEIQGASGLVIPTGKRSFSWHGTKGSHIRQATNAAPVITVGDITTSTGFEDNVMDGFRVSHINDQVGQSSGSALRFGMVRNSRFSNFEIGADYNASGPTVRSYKGIEILNGANATGFFSNKIADFRVSGAIVSLLDMSLMGSGSRWENGYFTQGITGTPGSLSGPAIDISGSTDLYETVFDTINVEHIIASDVPVMTLQSCRGLTFMGCHFEGNRITGFDPRFAQISTSQINFVGGNQMQDLEVPTSGASGLTSVLFAYYGEASSVSMVRGNLTLSWSAPSKVLRTLQIGALNRYAATSDRTLTQLDIDVRDVGGNNASFLDYTDQTSRPVTDIIRAITGDVTYTLPAGWTIDDIYYRNTTANAVTGGIKIGTSSGGTQVVSAQAIGANAVDKIVDSSISVNFFSRSADQVLYIQDVTAWNSASVDLHIVRSKHW